MKKNSCKWFNVSEAASYLSISQSKMCDLWCSGKVPFFDSDRRFEDFDNQGEMRRYSYKIDLDNYKERKN